MFIYLRLARGGADRRRPYRSVVLSMAMALLAVWPLLPAAALAQQAAPGTALLQETPSEPEESELPPLPILSAQPLGGKDNAWSVAAGDLNGDGFVDLVVGGGAGELDGPNLIYFNDGRGRFGSQEMTRQFAPPSTGRAVALADVNGDGVLDIVAGVYQGANEVYLNDGSGNLAAVQHFGSETAETRSVAAGDLNGDGYLDIVIGNGCMAGNGDGECDPVQVFINDQQGRFDGADAARSLPAADAGQGAGAVALADVDGDGSLDVIVGYLDAPNVVYLNDGQGTLGLDRAHQFGARGWTESLAVGDLDGQNGLDLVEVNVGQDAPEFIYLNDGSGTFEPGLELAAEGYTDIVAVTPADLDGDGFLDLVAAAGDSEMPERNLVLMNDGSGAFGQPLGFGSPNTTTSVAVADFNGDGVLDIVVGNYQGAEVWVYLREIQGIFARALEIGPKATSRGVALGDMDGNGYLDVVTLAGSQDPNTIYLNDGRCLAAATCPVYQFGSASDAYDLALGDLNGDDLLDVVQVGEGQNYIYFSGGAGDTFELREPVPLGSLEEDSRSVVVADIDGNGLLDVVVGNLGQNYLYLNDSEAPGTLTARPFGTGSDATYGLAAGDLDQDGYLDLVVGNGHSSGAQGYVAAEQNRLYLNDSRGSFPEARPFGKADDTAAVVLADLNGDGRLDVAVGNGSSDRNQVYYNAGGGNLSPGTSFGSFKSVRKMAAGDLEGDGDLDLVLGLSYGTEAYLNDGNGVLGEPLRLDRVRDYGTSGLALGDLNGDGMVDLLVSRGSAYALPSRVRLNRLRLTAGLVNTPPYLAVGYPASTPQAGFHFSPRILDERYISIPLALYDHEGDAVGRLAAFYSLDGGGRWLAAVPGEGTPTSNLAASPTGASYEFVWDTLATGVFGASDSVLVRFEVYAQPRRGAAPGSYLYHGRAGGPAPWPYTPATTALFRVRGAQVRVVDENGQALQGAYVYRLPKGAHAGAQLMPDPLNPLATDAQGFVPGRGALAEGDRLVALLPSTPSAPIPFTNQYHFYYTSAAPTEDGLDMKTVDDTGVVVLTVPTDPNGQVHPLMLFDLTVSIEWDATQDTLFMLALEESFQRASELLFDVTDGQVALGRVHVLPAKTFWNRADVIIYANNSMRPSAAIGGVVSGPVGDMVRPGYGQDPTEVVTAAYLPGQVRMGTSWDPFGENTGDLGEQWWRALAHELSHHLLFLPDNYVGLKADPNQPQGKRYLGRIDCQGSFMTTTRDPAYSEFLTTAGWSGDCQDSLAENTTGRPDWQTITTFYRALSAPDENLAGPTILPLDVTRLIPWRLPYERANLPARNFDLRDEEGQRIRLPNAQVYLFQRDGTEDPTDDVLVALGSPTAGGDRIKVHGALPGDRLCLFDFSRTDKTYLGCVENLDASKVSIQPIKALEVGADAVRWAPTLQVQALTTRTLSIEVGQEITAGLAFKAQVFPAHYPSFPGGAPTTTLTLVDEGTYRGEITLPYPASDVSVRVWVDGGSNREAISQFFLQLPWQAGDKLKAGPDMPILGGADNPLLGGADNPLLGGADNPLLGGADNPLVGGVEYPVLGGGDYPLVGGGDYPILGGVDQPLVGGSDNPILGGADNPLLGGTDETSRGTADNPLVGGADNPLVGGADNPLVGGADNPLVGGADNPLVGGADNPLVGGADNVVRALADNPLLGGGDYPIVGGAPRREFSAPILSADSQVVIYDQGGLFEPSGIRSLQILPTPPELADEPWLVPVGQAYFVEPEEGTDSPRTIAFTYLQRDVPEGYEHTLDIYFLPAGDESGRWQRLETEQFVENLVVADLQAGAGTYAVMSTVGLPTFQPGWNLFAYPLPDARGVITALESIEGRYSVIYEPEAEGQSLEAYVPVAQSPAVESVLPLVNLYIRSGPGVSYKAIGFLRKGERAARLDTDATSGWHRITCPPGLEDAPQCWVSGSKKYVRLMPGAETARGALESLPGNVESNVRQLKFGHVYWIKIEGDGPVTLYLAPPRRSPDGTVPGRR